MPPRELVFDTSVLISLVRSAAWDAESRRILSSGRFWLSSVAVGELYAGTRSPEDGLQVAYLANAAERRRRVLTPDADDWARAGRLFARRVRRTSAMNPRDHILDLLILLSAARVRASVLTVNVRHFEAWTRYLNASGYQVEVVPFVPPT